jgi:type VI protein secretion system component VasK
MERHMPKGTRLAHRLAREVAMKEGPTREGRMPKMPKLYSSEEIMAGATIVAAMLGAGRLTVSNPKNADGFAQIAEMVVKCASAISQQRGKVDAQVQTGRKPSSLKI